MDLKEDRLGMKYLEALWELQKIKDIDEASRLLDDNHKRHRELETKIKILEAESKILDAERNVLMAGYNKLRQKGQAERAD